MGSAVAAMVSVCPLCSGPAVCRTLLSTGQTHTILQFRHLVPCSLQEMIIFNKKKEGSGILFVNTTCLFRVSSMSLSTINNANETTSLCNSYGPIEADEGVCLGS